MKVRGPERSGEVVAVTGDDRRRHRAIIIGRADEERGVELAEHLKGTLVRAGDSMLLEPARCRSSELPELEVEELVPRKSPMSARDDIGGLDDRSR
ncbi:MAG: hypothetical protein R2710_17715 [Acidimicrobiales bacterium]